jgi:hypothetical protein
VELPYEFQTQMFQHPVRAAFQAMLADDDGAGADDGRSAQDQADCDAIPKHLVSTLEPDYAEILYPTRYPRTQLDRATYRRDELDADDVDTASLCPLWTLPARKTVLEGDMGLIQLLEPDSLR